MTERDGSVLLTGATGFVGMELLARYLERGRGAVSSRSSARSSDAAARERGSTACSANLFGARGRPLRGCASMRSPAS